MQLPTTGPVAFQGEPGAYSEAAIMQAFGEPTATLPCPSFDQLFAAVDDGVAVAGMVPIENSLAGSVLENYDLLMAHRLPIVGEVRLAVRHRDFGSDFRAWLTDWIDTDEGRGRHPGTDETDGDHLGH